mmetsp:Transcript_378/g.1095  ORF Transcript_378/g.1095 Transcript_378/m.1095 type:complete len:226 (+) Transcript_378:860-1537(+)
MGSSASCSRCFFTLAAAAANESINAFSSALISGASSASPAPAPPPSFALPLLSASLALSFFFCANACTRSASCNFSFTCVAVSVVSSATVIFLVATFKRKILSSLISPNIVAGCPSVLSRRIVSSTLNTSIFASSSSSSKTRTCAADAVRALSRDVPAGASRPCAPSSLSLARLPDTPSPSASLAARLIAPFGTYFAVDAAAFATRSARMRAISFISTSDIALGD